MKTKIKADFIAYLCVLIFALLFLYFGNRIATNGLGLDFGFGLALQNDMDEMIVVPGRVERILDVFEHHDEHFSFSWIEFEARITEGEYRNEIVIAIQTRDEFFFGGLIKEVEPGDRILLTAFTEPIDEREWYFLSYVRINRALYLGGAFAALLLFFGRIKGLSALLSLGFTCSAIFAVFLPAVLSGRNIYIWAIIVCIFSIIVTLFLLNGINKKSYAAVAGCLGGVVGAGLITLFMNQVLLITGAIDADSRSLLALPIENQIDLTALVFAGIIIGAVGAVMDVAVSISSALWELKAQAPNMTFKDMFSSGINIGKDIIGSMTNTLVLAYIGSSLSIILIFIVYTNSLTELLNSELVIVELLQAIVGGMGILLTMPLTALVCASLFADEQMS